MIVHVTDNELVDKMWPVVGPLLDKAVKRSNGCYELEDVLQELRSGRQELWVDWEEGQQINAAMTTSFDQYPRKKTIKVIFIGGSKIKKWLPEFRSLIESYGKRNGADLLEGYGRRGWGRVWPGLRESFTGYIKEL